MGYLKKIGSLEERASAQVAINLCQENAFKEVALCLEKPTYGTFIHRGSSPPFVSDPKKLSTWATMRENDWSYGVFMRSCYLSDTKKVEQWDAVVDEQCQRLTEGLPHLLKHGIHAWINRIALEYLSYCRRQEALFGVSRYFLMDVFTREDWTEAGRLDEEKLAERLLKDERLTVLQQYRIACVYCLHVDIPQLWKRLTQEEKQSISGNDNPSLSQENNRLILLWSYYMDSYRDKKVTRGKNHLWTYAVQQAACDGNQVVLMRYWKGLREDIRQQMVIDMALQSLQQWQSIQNECHAYGNWREKLMSDESPYMRFEYIRHFNLPSYSELVCFFLSKMNEEQQLTFFKKAFQSKYCSSVLECFLDWPHQDDFLPTMNRLWKIVPKDRYGQCLLTLASKYSGDYDRKRSSTSLYKKENRYYDYRTLLWRLWEETPEEYKRYVFLDKESCSVGYRKTVINEGKVLLPRLLERSPFQEKDEALFKRILRDLPQEERIAIMRSKAGENICSTLTQKERWSLVNWLLEECLPKEEIPSFKKQFIQSDWGHRLCFSQLEENREKLLEDVINWAFELATEKTQFKYELIDGRDCLDACKSLLSKGKFTQVERMINFCVPSDEMKGQFKVGFAKYTCAYLLKDRGWEQMDKILVWGFDAEEKIRDFKKDLFSCEGIDTHYKFVLQKQWEDIERFYTWFFLLPEEIRKIKKETIFTPEAIQDINEALYEDTDVLVAPLHWCLTDEEMVISFKETLEKGYFKQVLDEEEKKAKGRLDDLVSVLLYDLKEVRGKTSREDSFMKDKGEKRSSIAAEDEFSSPKKRFKAFKSSQT